MGKTSVHVAKVKAGSEQHNNREKDLDYVKKDLTNLNESFELCTIAERLNQKKQKYQEATGQKMQAKASPIREGVIVIGEKTSMEQLQLYARKCKERFGIEAIQIHIHRDEGHEKEGKWISNLHAHMVFDWTANNGKSIKLNRQDMAEMQTLLSVCLEMERGKSSELKHLNAVQFKVEAEEKRLLETQKQTEENKAILSHFNEVKPIYDKFSKEWFDNSKLRVLTSEIDVLKQENKGLVSQIKEIRNELDRSKANENYALRMVKEFENDSFAAASKILTLEKSLEKALERPKEILSELNFYQHERKGINHHFYIKDDGAMAVMSAEEYTKKLEEARLRKEEKRAKALAEAKEKESKAPTYDPKLAKPVQEDKTLKAPTYDPDFDKKKNNNQMKM